ncbi:EhaG family protein [Methanoplanus endosymbiosus]|uniref:EhaG family protein n=1 Tax=Methanoplanus endosymbiosus TaxID=33865 RepID=A0A9E7PPA6_9EURY|nr:EhaG family protein [Methanoplanus endosymbiosus]UUX93893.1 EhaG family protein [Methanoplanus endosymbiosus]
MDQTYFLGITVIFAASAIVFIALFKEKNDLHRLILTDLAEIVALALIAMVATDLAEALILPGLVVGISELLAISEIYLVREGLTKPVKRKFRLEIMDSAPAIMALVLVAYGIVLSGFSGGAVAATGAVFFFMCKGSMERFEILEIVSGYAWAFWIVAFFIFMILPQYWFFAVMLAGGAILVKVMAKMSLIGTMGGEENV